MENTKILTEVQMKAIEKAAEVITEVFNTLWEVITVIAQNTAEMWRQVIASFPSKRVVTLALHHKDLRVRKKNTNRIIKWLRRLMRCKE